MDLFLVLNFQEDFVQISCRLPPLDLLLLLEPDLALERDTLEGH